MEGMDTFLASAGAVFYDMGHTAWGHPVSSAVATALLVVGVVCGEPMLDRLFGKISHAGMRQLLTRWFPGPGSALMGIAFVEGLEKVVAHHMTDTAAALDVSYVQGLGAMWFVTFFGMHTFLHHLRDAPDAAKAKLEAKLLCLADDIPALALVLAS